MRSHLKSAAIGAAAVLGLFSAAAIAQPAADQRAQPNQQMGQQMMQGPEGMGGMMAMMQDPKMREQMMKMMGACQKMIGEMQTHGSVDTPS